MSRYRITPRAAEDLRRIARYTLETWGRAQRDIYLSAIDRRFSWLAENPTLGKPRPEVAEGYHSYPQGAHVIFYLVHADRIDIIGVPHQRMDVVNYFSG
jgi:toxin ParE1/3/4